MVNKKHKGHEEFYEALQRIRDKADAKEEELIDLIGRVYEKVKDGQELAMEKIQHTANTVNTSVHLHPWHYIGGAALLGLITGMCFGRCSRESAHPPHR